MRSFIILALFCLVGWSRSQKCPEKYQRFSAQHTFCLPPNPTCEIEVSGVSPHDRKLILRLHNQFRSKTAMGNEDRAVDGSLPQAADMIHMEWDDELAAVAQKWTENCIFDHDCDECKAVENFAVGQNLALQNVHCSGQGCKSPKDKPDWTSAITSFYDEVKGYHVGWLDSFTTHPGVKVGHLTQLIWSRSWKVGCGYSFYKQGGGYHKYYACNYGPGGNVEGQPVYKKGKPCSACPTNTKCSTSIKGRHPGLCQMIYKNRAPFYARDEEGLLFYCGVSSKDPDCMGQFSGNGTWRNVHSIGGNYLSAVLSGGQSTSIIFKNPVTPHGDAFCLSLYFRKGPVDASTGDVSSFQTNFQMEGATSPPSELNPGTTSFINFNVGLPWGTKTKIGFTFSVPSGAGKHILDIRKVAAYDGPCP